ncbi:MAG: magnesium transporter [Cellvibrionaceae bacterium]|nr:magnesium transporter [Cellvibrionaceae bacterium]
MQPLANDDFDKTQLHLDKLSEVLDTNGELHIVKRMLKNLTAVEIARLLESSPPRSRQFLWTLVDNKTHAQVLQALPEELAADFVKDMDSQQVADLTELLHVDDAADILQQLPDQVIQEILAAMSAQNRARVETVLSFEEDTAGGLMDTDVITVRPRFTLDVVLRYLRRHDEIPASTDQIFIVNEDNIYLGSLSVSRLLTADPHISVRELMCTDLDAAIPVTMPDSQVAQRFEQHNWVSAPVVDADGHILGRITIDDVVDVIIDDASHPLLSMAGLGEDEDTFAPLHKTAPRRALWLGVNLITAVIASAVINVFQDTLDKVVALAVLMPIVASMGGVAGSQTLTLVIRGIAVGQVGSSNLNWLLTREVLSSFLNGLLWACALGALTAWWFQDIRIAWIIGVATTINLVAAAIGGTLLPPILKHWGIDPALAGGVALTTLTDVVGFMAFLGLATFFYA